MCLHVNFLANKTIAITFSTQCDDNGPLHWYFSSPLLYQAEADNDIELTDACRQPERQLDIQNTRERVNIFELKQKFLQLEADKRRL